MDEKITLLIVDDSETVRAILQKLLSFDEDLKVIGTASDGREGIDAAIALEPDLVLMDLNMPEIDGIQATEELSLKLPTVPVIIMSVEEERDYLRRAMQAGAREFVIKPFNHDEVVGAIHRVYQMEKAKGTYAAKALASVVREADQPSQSKATGPADVYLITSAKGGVGKTMLASNLAIALANQTGRRVALVDLDLQYGDIGVTLNIDHPRNITHLIDSIDNLDDELLNEVLAETSNGVRVLLAPLSPEVAELVTPEHLRVLLSELRTEYDIVVVDSATQLSEFSVELMEMATKIVFITSPTLQSVKNTKLALKVTESLTLQPTSLAIVINSIDSIDHLSSDAIENSIRYPIAVRLPHAPKIVGDATMQGSAFVVLHPDAEISRSVRSLAGHVLGLGTAMEPEPDTSATDRKRRWRIFRR